MSSMVGSRRYTILNASFTPTKNWWTHSVPVVSEISNRSSYRSNGILYDSCLKAQITFNNGEMRILPAQFGSRPVCSYEKWLMVPVETRLKIASGIWNLLSKALFWLFIPFLLGPGRTIQDGSSRSPCVLELDMIVEMLTMFSYNHLLIFIFFMKIKWIHYFALKMSLDNGQYGRNIFVACWSLSIVVKTFDFGLTKIYFSEPTNIVSFRVIIIEQLWGWGVKYWE